MDNLRIRSELSSQIRKYKAKQKLNSEYGRYSTEYIKSVYHSGKTICKATSYVDTDSVIVSHDKTPCMYDMLERLEEINEKRSFL